MRLPTHRLVFPLSASLSEIVHVKRLPPSCGGTIQGRVLVNSTILDQALSQERGEIDS